MIEGQVGALSAQTDLEGSWLNSHFLSVFPLSGVDSRSISCTTLHSAPLLFPHSMCFLFLLTHFYTHTHTEKRDTGTYVLSLNETKQWQLFFNTECKFCILPTKKHVKHNVVCNEAVTWLKQVEVACLIRKWCPIIIIWFIFCIIVFWQSNNSK